MTCHEAEGMILPYINKRLKDEDMEGFLNHVLHCESCMEELEIYFTVDYGIRRLDDDEGTYNIKEALFQNIDSSLEHIKKVHILTIFRYVMTTLSTMGIIIIFLLQLRIWWQTGIF